MLLAILVLATAASFFAPSVGAAWEMNRFEVNMVIGPDARLRVAETLSVNLGPERSRGIYRTLPLSVMDRTGARHRYSLRLVAVTDGEGKPRPTRVRRRGEYVEIWLGQEQTFVSGEQVYIIAYEVEGAILRGPSWDELKWNVTGRPWNVPIIAAEVTIEFPPGANTDEVDGTSYVSKFGQLGRQSDWKLLDGSRARFVLRRGLVPFEEFTVTLAWPAGLVTHPRLVARAMDRLRQQPILLLPVLALLAGLWVDRRRRPRAPVHPNAGIPAPPAGVTPAEVGMIVDERHALRPADIAATIFDLAARGRLKIEYAPGSGRAPGVVLHRGREGPGEAIKAHEEAILGVLFDTAKEGQRADGGRDRIHANELGTQFHRHLARIRRLVESELVRAGNLDREATGLDSRGARWAIGVLIAGLLGGYAWAVAGGQFFPQAWLPIAASSAVASLVVWVGARMMPRRTRAGARILAWAQSFEERSGEARPNVLGTSAGEARSSDGEGSARQTKFESVFPYAVVLAVAEPWARAFGGRIESPRWWLASATVRSDRVDRDMVFVSRVLAAAIMAAPRSAPGTFRSGSRSGV